MFPFVIKKPNVPVGAHRTPEVQLQTRNARRATRFINFKPLRRIALTGTPVEPYSDRDQQANPGPTAQNSNDGTETWADSPSSLFVVSAGVNTTVIGTTPKRIENRFVLGQTCSRLPSKYLYSFYDVMYYLGVSSYRVQTSKPTGIFTSKVVKYLLKIPFCVVTLLSCSQSIFQAKYNFLNFLSGKGYSTFVDFSYHFVAFCVKIYAVDLFALKQKETMRMLEIVEDYSMEYYKKPANPKMHLSHKFCWLIGLSTLLFGVARAIFASGINGWSLENSILQNSYEFSEDIFIWSSITTGVLGNLEMEYATNVTTTSILFGSIVILRNCASNTQIGIILDLVLLVALVLQIVVGQFMQELKETIENVPQQNQNAAASLQTRREIVWKKYRKIKEVTDAINDVYDPMLKLVHVSNLLMYAFFMTLCLFRENTAIITIVLYFLNLVKAELAYYVAGKIAQENSIIRAWIRNWAVRTGCVAVNSEDLNVTVLLDELDQEPIGLGRGTFLIQTTSHYKVKIHI